MQIADNLVVQGTLTATAVAVTGGSVKNTTISTVGAGVLTGAAIAGGLVTRAGTQIANFSDATDTAANIIAALPTPTVNESVSMRILNTTTFQQTVTGGTGVTLSGKSFILAPNCFADVLFTYTGAGAVSAYVEAVVDIGIDNLNATTDPGVNNDNTQGYGPGSIWINSGGTAPAINREWTCISATTGAAVWSFGGASYSNSGSNPPNEVTQAGSSTALMAEEGNINRQVPGVAGGVNPGATGADNVLAVYSLPANFFDGLAGTNRGITVTAAGNFASTGNNKRCKLFFNPSAAVVGSTITGGTLMADTGTVATNNGAWWLGGNIFKRGAAGSNTQTVTSNGAIAGASHAGISLAVDTTAVENAAILIAVTGNATTATTDIIFSWLEVNAMN